MTPERRPLTDSERDDAERIWDYHQLHHALRPCSVAICLGGPDPGLASLASSLYHRGLFPLLVFTGANSDDTVRWYPRGEAVDLRDRAVALGVPSDAVLIEPNATNSGQNIDLSRKVLIDVGIEVKDVMLVSMPYMQRRAFATCRKFWPEVDIVCASEPIGFDTYAERIGDAPLALDMIIGDLQRVMLYPARGFAIEQEVPVDVHASYGRLVDAGYTSRLAAG